MERIDAENRRFDNESFEDQFWEEGNYQLDELEDEYDIKEIEEAWENFISHFTFPNFLALVVAAKWVFLVLFLGIPWLLFSQSCLIYNIVFNAWLNAGWAEGNFWLLGNTFYAIVQTWLSYGIMFEVYPYLKWGVAFRIWSFISAVVYNSLYFFMLFGWLTEVAFLPLQPDSVIEEMSYLDVFMNMLFVYNSIQHSPICFINIVIILKEIQILIYESFVTQDNYYSLSWQEGRQTFWEITWYFDPVRLLPWILQRGFSINLEKTLGQYDFIGMPNADVYKLPADAFT